MSSPYVYTAEEIDAITPEEREDLWYESGPMPPKEPQGVDEKEILDAEIIDPSETREAMLSTGYIQTPLEVCIEVVQSAINNVDRLYESQLARDRQAHVLHHLHAAKDYLIKGKEDEDAE